MNLTLEQEFKLMQLERDAYKCSKAQLVELLVGYVKLSMGRENYFKDIIKRTGI